MLVALVSVVSQVGGKVGSTKQGDCRRQPALPQVNKSSPNCNIKNRPLPETTDYTTITIPPERVIRLRLMKI